MAANVHTGAYHNGNIQKCLWAKPVAKGASTDTSYFGQKIQTHSNNNKKKRKLIRGAN